MCGIAGIYNFRSGRPAAPSELRAMGACLAHRGPDDEGYYEEGPLGLAHKRLTILDTSRRGRQPMFTEDGQLAITFNGEVYNFLELRADLEARGHTFQTQTDTEVILRLYQIEGEDMLSRLNGMFAFAIWDRRTKRLFIARDRLGIKPLYFTLNPDGIVFASEIKALFAVTPERPKVHLEMLDAYMSVGYVPTEQTLFQGIEKLQPGWCMTVDRDGPRLRQYWDLKPAPEEMSEEECIRRVDRTAARLGPPPAPQRRPSRRLPLGRRGFERRRGADARDGHPRHPHLHRRLRLRPRVRRDPLRAAGGREVRHRPPRDLRHSPGVPGFHPVADLAHGRAGHRVGGGLAVLRLQAGARGRRRGALGRGVGRGLRRLSDLQVHADAGALPPAPPRRAPGHDQPHAQPARRQVEQVHRALRSAARQALHGGFVLRDRAPRTRSTGRRSEIFSTAAPCRAW